MSCHNNNINNNKLQSLSPDTAYTNHINVSKLLSKKEALSFHVDKFKLHWIVSDFIFLYHVYKRFKKIINCFIYKFALLYSFQSHSIFKFFYTTLFFIILSMLKSIPYAFRLGNDYLLLENSIISI